MASVIDSTYSEAHGSPASRAVAMSPSKPRPSYSRGGTGDYLQPIVKSAVRRWQRHHEQFQMKKLTDKRGVKKDKSMAIKETAKEVAKRIPIEVLAQEWMSMNNATIETRAFLVDKLLPTLILGLEKLLLEVDKKQLADTTEPDANFNPLNYLAQYLLRNNPRYSNFSEASPYIRGLRDIADQLKQQLFSLEDNRLARIKADARKRREDREASEVARRRERERRDMAMNSQFLQWGVGPEGRIELALLQNALRSFVEIVEHYPEELQSAASYSHTLEPTDDSGKTLSLREFSLYLGQFVQAMPPEIFDSFLSHLSKCSLVFRSQVEKGQRRVVLTNLFVSCDHSGIGMLDRHRILALFDNFYERAGIITAKGLRNPRKWPVVEMDEAESDYSDTEEQQPTLIDNNVDVTHAPKKAKAVSPEPQKQSDESLSKAGDNEEKENENSEEMKADESEGKKEDTNEDEEKKETIKEDENAGEDSKGAEAKEEPRKDDENAVESDKKSEEEPEKENVPTEEKIESIKEENNEEDNRKDEEKTEKEKSEEPSKEEEQAKPEVKDTDKQQQEKEGELDEESKEKVETEGKGDTKKDDGQIVEEDEEVEGELDDKGDMPLPKTPGGRLDEPPRTQQTGRTSVSFAEGTTFEKERALLSTMESTRSQSVASAFDENSVNTSQFVQLTETFLGDLPEMESFTKLVQYVRNGYVETDEEKIHRLREARREAIAAKRKALLNSLFEMWDNDGSGLLEFEDVQTVMEKYKDGMELDSIKKAKKRLQAKKGRSYDSRLTKREFRDYVELVATEIPEDDAIDYLVEFLMSCVEKTYAERIRGDARKKWLKQVITAAETGGASMDPVYRAVFQALYKDAETHGGGKKISANISILERNDRKPERGTTLLRYVATTPDDADILLGKHLYRDMKNISFSSVDSGKPIHVPRVSNHGGIHLWNSTRPAEIHEAKEVDGSFIVVPLKDEHKRVFGLLGLDTLNDPQQKSIFITHEIQFFQGITKSFSIAYHYVDIRRKILRICESAVSWIIRRSPSVRNITIYMVEPDLKNNDFVLRRMVTSDEKGVAKIIANPPRLERKDNLFRDYLFKCVDNSETVMADAYGERHLAFPLRDSEGRCLVSVDISIDRDLKKLPSMENKEVMRMLKLLTQAYKELAHEASAGEKNLVLEAERNEDNRVEILFDRLMLMDLRDNVAKLDARAYAELKSYKDPPPIIHNILKAVISVFYVDKAESGELDDWSKCKIYVNVDLSRKIMAYDPTDSKGHDNINIEKINEYLNEVPHNAVAKHGSIPAQYLYNWVFVCSSLIEHTRKMAADKNIASLEVTDKDEPQKMIRAEDKENTEIIDNDDD